jgi:oxygen-independent coproporphyrinogen III oxidase
MGFFGIGMKHLHLYIHVPFCQQKCMYCDFYSMTDLNLIEKYLEALKQSIKYHGEAIAEDYSVRTIYFGGGTPNLLSASQLEDILNTIDKYFNVVEFPETTIEINPEFSSDRESLKALFNAGFTRLSIGIQSLNENELKILGRLHDRETAIRCLMNAKRVFSNVSVDVIFSIPGQTPASLNSTLGTILNLEPEHISAYGLTCEAGTPYAKMVNTGKLNLPTEDRDRQFFLYIEDIFRGRNYRHYEVSNYAKPDFKSKHNSAYWTGADYLGLGPSAHSKMGDLRSSYRPDLKAFIDDPCAFHESEPVSPSDTLITHLRMENGLHKDQVSEDTWEAIQSYARQHPEWFVGFSESFEDDDEDVEKELDPNRIRCTTEGWLFLDTILVDLI